MKCVLSRKRDGRIAPVWHLVFFGKTSTIILVDELTYTSGYSQGTNRSDVEWFLSTEHFGSEGNGSGVSSPTTPDLSYRFGDWYVEALNGKGHKSDDVQEAAEYVDHKMSVKEVKSTF